MTETNEQKVALLLGQHADKVLALIQVGFFDMQNGSVTVHFDAQGKIRKFDKHLIFNVVDIN